MADIKTVLMPGETKLHINKTLIRAPVSQMAPLFFWRYTPNVNRRRRNHHGNRVRRRRRPDGAGPGLLELGALEGG